MFSFSGEGFYSYGNCSRSLCIAIPIPCSNLDWWKGTKREIDASSGVVYIYVKAPIWAEWMSFDPNGELCFYSSQNSWCDKPFLCPNPFHYGHEWWGYVGKCRTSDFRIKVPENIKNKDWWKDTLRKVE
jgi:hypothetical protein